jgi:hypothetical protein
VSSNAGTLHICLPDLFLMCSGIPAWKRLIDPSHTSDEQISLITDIFSDRSETETVKRLSGDDAQSFVDVVDQVFPSVVVELNISDMSRRYWIA